MTNKLELIWIGKDEEIKLEPRILLEDKDKSYGEPNSENMLIHGDNLLALKALESRYANKIKCIYIDPPYNTGSAFEHYDDNLEHSIWLNLMRNRIMILKKLLSKNGVFCIHCDDSEQAYLKVLCDELLGRNNFLNMLVIETGEVFGTKAAHIDKTFVKVKDYILIYVLNKDENFNLKPLWTKTNDIFDTHYSYYIKDLKKESLIDFLKKQEWITKLFVKYELALKMENISKVMNLDSEFSIYINEELSKNIFQDQPYSKNIPEDIKEKLEIFPIVEYDGLLLFKTASGSIRYYKSFYDSIHLTDDYLHEKTRSTARGDLWKNYHIDMRNINDEGGVKFKASKKPERLIRDILYTFTKEGDYVLDSFLGSGTTCAVAHKMNRRWIGIEFGEHCYNLSKVRLDNVINGDQTGISKLINWQGGGGYKFYELAPTLIKTDSFGELIINEQYNADMLASAVALHEGFEYNPSNEVFWKQSKGSEKSYLYVTTKYITENVLESIKSTMKDDEYLVIACTSFDSELKNKYKNITLKKIPQMLLKNCEFDKENYNLNIIEPPIYEDCEGEE